MAMRRSVFISYTSEQKRIADSIAFAIRELELQVFVDRDDLTPGVAFHDRIHSEIERCDVFVFLLSKESISPDRYTMSELEFARQKWLHPSGHVLTVPIGEYDRAQLPPYLGVTTFVSPVGNIPTNVRAAVKNLIREHIESEKFASRCKKTLGTFFQVGIGKPVAYVNSSNLIKILDDKMSEGGGRIFVTDLKDELDKNLAPAQPHWVAVEGVFFPGTLMSIGWWKRRNKQLAKIKWNDPSWQGWFFSGFEQWAPSWDINDWSAQSPTNLVGQIGANDEADSIPVLVKSPSKAAEIREDLADQLVLNACVRGLLCHESHFPLLDQLNEEDRGLLDIIKKVTDAQYYIIVFDGDDARNEVQFMRKKVDYYSGYLWQCWSPKEWIPPDPFQTKLPGTYFVWEHSNLADKDVVRFGLDSLEAKLGLLRRRLQKRDLSGDMVLLQHLMSSDKLGGEPGRGSDPAIPIDQFTSLFASDAADQA